MYNPEKERRNERMVKTDERAFFRSAEKYLLEQPSGKFDVMHGFKVEKDSFMLVVQLA